MRGAKGDTGEGRLRRFDGIAPAVRFAALIVVLLLVTVGVYAVWSNVEQQRASEQKVLEEARLLSMQMSASWDYVDSVQDSINYNSDGHYDFKGIYCSVAGKSIALRFTKQTDCTIRYTRESPRTGTDAPDEFEAAALAAFGAGESEYYGVADYEGEQVFRYVSAIHLTYGCLQCHGEPAGELDETGYPKEGMALGDLAGAVSLIIPMRQYQDEAVARAGSNVLLFVVLAVIIVAATSVALRYWARREREFQSTFLATMSHELRTPLTSIISSADMYLRTPESGRADGAELAKKVRRSGKELLGTVNNTLDAASIEARRFVASPEPVDLLDVANAVEALISPLAAERSLDFRVEADPSLPVVKTDPEIVHKILVNLLGNAVKFTEEGGSVRLAMGVDRRRGVVTFEVADTGIGIPEADLRVIFERFKQADSGTSRKYGGSGLGLSLVKEMTGLLGGSVRVRSREGEGSVFTVEIPYEEVEGGQE